MTVLQFTDCPSLSDQASSTLQRYFASFNQGQFQQTAQLFSMQGKLVPPFDSPIVGRAAIEAYLEQEAAGMVAEPLESQIEHIDSDRLCIVVKGKVKTLVFKVNVTWTFWLTSTAIDEVHIRLLTSIEELVKLRPLM